MEALTCKMCGGKLHYKEGASVCRCEYCGNTNTLALADSEQEMIFFNRANHFRRMNEFDRAINAYEKILDANSSNAEAHWGIVLSRYGIEYVEDPATHERIPTCHRVQPTSILSDPDYLASVQYADVIAAAEYKAQAERIAEIQKDILAVSSREKPYDVFICYKESDEDGNRTVDSTLAQDIYYSLAEAGYRVFFSRITMEDKLGQQYEPYIFAALTSAKVMIVVGTKPEYFNAVWVKNEWSRYLALMKSDRQRLLIPCYKDMSPYELPDELSMLQGQDMGKIGFKQDLIYGIGKAVGKDKTNGQQASAEKEINTLLKRGYMALEDKDWGNADAFFEKALNLDTECAEAYLGKLLVKKRRTGFQDLIAMYKGVYHRGAAEKLQACPEETRHIQEAAERYSVQPFLSRGKILQLYQYNLQYKSVLSSRKGQKEKQLRELSEERLLVRAQQYAGENLLQELNSGLTELMETLDRRIENAENEDRVSIENIKKGYREFLLQQDSIVEKESRHAEEEREKSYQNCLKVCKSETDISGLKEARDAFESFGDYKNSREMAVKCQKEIDRKQNKIQRRRTFFNWIGKHKRASAVIILIAFVFMFKVVIPSAQVNLKVLTMKLQGNKVSVLKFKKGEDFNKLLKEYDEKIIAKYGKSGGDTDDDSNNYGVRSFVFTDKQVPSRVVTEDLAESGLPVIMWLDEDADTIYIHTDADKIILKDASHMFENMHGIEEIDLSKFDMSSVKDMEGMFLHCYSIENLDLSMLDLKNVTNMMEMFGACKSLTTVDLSGLDVGSVTNMAFMFVRCSSLKNVNLSGIKTGKPESLDGLFQLCESLETVDLTGFDTSNVSEMNSMFNGCNSLKEIDLSGFDTKQVESMNSMFRDCHSLKTLDLSGFNTNKLKEMSLMFIECTELEKLDLSGFDTSQVTDMGNLFYHCDHLVELLTEDARIWQEYKKKVQTETIIYDVNEISPEIMEQMSEKGKEIFRQHVDQEWAYPDSFISITLAGKFFLTAKENVETESKNAMIMVYEVKAYKPADYTEEFTYYYYVIFKNISSLPDGTTVVNLENYRCPGGSLMSWALETIDFGMLSYDGFRTLENLYETVILSNTDRFDYQTTFSQFKENS